MRVYRREECFHYMVEMLPDLEQEIKALLSALDENAESIYHLELVDEEQFIDSFLATNFPLTDKYQKSQIRTTFYSFINQL